MVKKTIIKKVREFELALIRNGIRVKKIILYGSQATGKYHKDSDIDVAVVSVDFGKNRTEEGLSLFKIAGEIDTRIEPVPISWESYKKDNWIPLIYEIKSKGIEVHLQ